MPKNRATPTMVHDGLKRHDDGALPDHALPTPLRRLVDGWRRGNGDTTQLSRSTRDGARPVLTPIVFSLFPKDGVRRFLTALATFCAWREDDSGERMLMLSWGQDAGDLRSLLGSSVRDGASGEIAFELLIPVEALSGTSRSTSPRAPTTGLSGVNCDRCGLPLAGLQWRSEVAYVQVVVDAETMHMLHGRCARNLLRDMVNA